MNITYGPYGYNKFHWAHLLYHLHKLEPILEHTVGCWFLAFCDNGIFDPKEKNPQIRPLKNIYVPLKKIHPIFEKNSLIICIRSQFSSQTFRSVNDVLSNFLAKQTPLSLITATLHKESVGGWRFFFS